MARILTYTSTNPTAQNTGPKKSPHTVETFTPPAGEKMPTKPTVSGKVLSIEMGMKNTKMPQGEGGYAKDNYKKDKPNY